MRGTRDGETRRAVEIGGRDLTREGSGMPEDHIGVAGMTVDVVGADDDVIESVAVAVTGNRHRPARRVTGCADGLEPVGAVQCRYILRRERPHRRTKRYEGSAVKKGLTGAQEGVTHDDVGKTIAVDIPRTCDGCDRWMLALVAEAEAQGRRVGPRL